MIDINLVRALRDPEYQSEIDHVLEGFDDDVLRHAAADEIDRLRIENETQAALIEFFQKGGKSVEQVEVELHKMEGQGNDR